MRLKYWLLTAVQSGVLVAFGSLVYVMMMLLMGVEGGVWELLTMASVMLLILGAAGGMGICAAAWKLNLSVALNFGSTRKEAFWGLQCHRIVYGTVVFAISAVLCVLAGKARVLTQYKFVPLGIGVLLLAATYGGMLGLLGTKVGKIAQAFLGVLTFFLLVGSAYAGVIWIIVMGEMDLPGAVWLFPAVSLLLYGLSMILEYKTVCKYNVKL